MTQPMIPPRVGRRRFDARSEGAGEKSEQQPAAAVLRHDQTNWPLH
jgi:hypothetical protein